MDGPIIGQSSSSCIGGDQSIKFKLMAPVQLAVDDANRTDSAR